MQLRRLILQGFKSFADRTEIDFADDITMIVGPNGCGKSNISDAVRWVLGEQNVRLLRGQKTEDLIFSGSATRKAKNSAEVTMVLDNSARELPIDTVDVAVTRRVLRNGESDFFINQRACRLKDIHDLFAATGLGKGTLAIIGQNRVDQVLSAHPEERRLIFEEVAGISRYRLRKEEGLGRLRQTEENMNRVQDLMAVLEERLGPMKEAADKAREYGACLREKQAAEATEALLKLASARRMRARCETEYESFAAEKGRWDTKLASADAERAAFEEAAAAQEEAYRKAGAEADMFRRSMDRLDGDYRVQEAVCQRQAEERDRIEKGLAAHRDAKAAAEAQLDRAEEEHRAAREEWTSAREAHAVLEREKAEAMAAYERELAAHQELAEIIREKTGQKERLLAAIRHGEDEAHRLADLQARAAELLQKGTSDVDEARAAIAALDAAAKAREAQMAALEAQGREENDALKQGQDRSFALLNQWNKAKAEEMQLASRQTYLVRAEKEYASFSEASRTVLQADMPWQSRILGAFGELIQVPEAYTAAAEAVLGGTVAYIVTDTAKTAGEIIQWMKEKHVGRTTFYPLDAMRPNGNDAREREAAREAGVRGIAADLFHCAPDLDALKRSVLGRVLIAEDMDTARRIARKYQYRLSIVTMDGQLFRPGGAVTGGSLRKRANTFFGRKQEIEALRKKLEEAHSAMGKLEADRKAQERDNADLSDRLGRTREAWQALHVEGAAANGRREGLVQALKAAEEARAKAALDAASWEDAAAKNGRTLEELRRELAAVGDIPALEDGEQGDRMKNAADQAAAAEADGRVRLAHAEERLHRAEEKEHTCRDALAAASQQWEEAEKELALRQSEEARVRVAMAKLAEQYEAEKAQWESAARRRDALQDETDQLMLKRQDNDRQRREAQEAALAAEKKMTEWSFRAGEEERREAEELQKLQLAGFTEATAEAQRLPGSMADIKKRLAAVQARMDALGPVNPGAEAEYALEEERCRSYQVQMEDLEQARRGIARVIEGIDTAMAAHFTEAFDKINGEFGQIMRLMFQGGSGRLVLTDPEHPLDSGVELYLELPGKKRQPLSLMSGGERALTVIALLISFLAYRPAPFCFVDEIDAALDDANVERFGRMIEEYKKRAQFIVITHRKKTMEYADTLQGVTMGEKGVSSLVTVHMGEYIKEVYDGIS